MLSTERGRGSFTGDLTGGSYPGGSYPWGSLTGGIFPWGDFYLGGSCHGDLTRGDLHRGDLTLGLVELCKNLLATTHKYVCFGKFTLDYIEKEFSKLRQGSGGTYFITVQQVIEKVNIEKTSLLLALQTDIDSLQTSAGHKCSSCEFKLREQDVDIFDSLDILEDFLPIDNKMAMVHIAGYVTRKDPAPTEEEMLDVTTFYHQKYGGYVDDYDRGQLNIPTDKAVQWSLFCEIIFESVKNHVCQSSLTDIFDQVSKHYQFGMTTRHSRILANIMLNRFCRESTPRSGKETKQKVIKLSTDE